MKVRLLSGVGLFYFRRKQRLGTIKGEYSVRLVVVNSVTGVTMRMESMVMNRLVGILSRLILPALIPLGVAIGFLGGINPALAAKAGSSAASSSASSDFRMTFDVSGAMGNTSNRNYQELSLGVNAYFYEWLVWRNSVFARFIEGSDNMYGLDTSARLVLNLGDSKFGLTAFAGPGYRFATSSGRVPADSAPFAEAGVVAKLGGLSIGGGVKTVFNSVVRSGAPEDTQYFLILAGGGSL